MTHWKPDAQQVCSCSQIKGLQVLKMVDNPHYLYRMTVLVAIASLAPAVNHDVLCGSMLPVVVGCSHDKVGCHGQPL